MLCDVSFIQNILGVFCKSRDKSYVLREVGGERLGVTGGIRVGVFEVEGEQVESYGPSLLRVGLEERREGQGLNDEG